MDHITSCVMLLAVGIFCREAVSQSQSCSQVNGVNYCYFTNNTNALSWSAAKQFCQNIGLDLPVVTDQYSQTALNNFLTSSGIINVAWLGLHAQPVNISVTWHWINKLRGVTPTHDVSGDGSRWCSALVKQSANSLVISEKNWYERLQYICQYNNATCVNGFVVNSACYKIFTETTNWFIAINNCIRDGGTLATFDDNYFLNNNNLTTLITGLTWIGLIKSWWTWRGGIDLQYSNFYDWATSDPPTGVYYYVPATTNTDKQCVVFGSTGPNWIVRDCTADHFICQNISITTPPPSISSTTTVTTTITMTTMPTTTSYSPLYTSSTTARTTVTKSTVDTGSSDAKSKVSITTPPPPSMSSTTTVTTTTTMTTMPTTTSYSQLYTSSTTAHTTLTKSAVDTGSSDAKYKGAVAAAVVLGVLFSVASVAVMSY